MVSPTFTESCVCFNEATEKFLATGGVYDGSVVALLQAAIARITIAGIKYLFIIRFLERNYIVE
jgi:hypothetical protein